MRDAAALDALLTEADEYLADRCTGCIMAHLKSDPPSTYIHSLPCRLAAALRSLRPPADATGTAICACGEPEWWHSHAECNCEQFRPVADRYTYTVPRPDAARGGERDG